MNRANQVKINWWKELGMLLMTLAMWLVVIAIAIAGTVWWIYS